MLTALAIIRNWDPVAAETRSALEVGAVAANQGASEPRARARFTSVEENLFEVMTVTEMDAIFESGVDMTVRKMCGVNEIAVIEWEQILENLRLNPELHRVWPDYLRVLPSNAYVNLIWKKSSVMEASKKVEIMKFVTELFPDTVGQDDVARLNFGKSFIVTALLIGATQRPPWAWDSDPQIHTEGYAAFIPLTGALRIGGGAGEGAEEASAAEGPPRRSIYLYL